ncbi:MAG: L-2-amino-thiazoline-4-carboxylic acid hydrolase [Candidatus Thorarchaeota archaeon]|jgi:hypothetical protein
MEFLKVGKCRPDALEQPREISPVEEITRAPLRRLDYLLELIKESNPEEVTNFVASLGEKYKKMTKTDNLGDGFEKINKKLSELDHLKEYPDLARLLVNYLLQVLQLPEGTDWVEDKVEVPCKNNLRLHLHPRYYNVQTLTETIDRSEALTLYKRYVTQYLKKVRDPERETYSRLEDLFEKRKQPRENHSDWEMVFGMIGEGKYAYRNDNCLWVDALADLDDSELKYMVCCYGDYEGAKVYHDDVILTMEHTIAQGNPYCSRVVHDTRVDYNLRHPPKEFWDNIEPSGEVKMGD